MTCRFCARSGAMYHEVGAVLCEHHEAELRDRMSNDWESWDVEVSFGGEPEIDPTRFLAEMQEACDAERHVTFAPALDAALGEA